MKYYYYYTLNYNFKADTAVKGLALLNPSEVPSTADIEYVDVECGITDNLKLLQHDMLLRDDDFSLISEEHNSLEECEGGLQLLSTFMGDQLGSQAKETFDKVLKELK